MNQLAAKSVFPNDNSNFGGHFEERRLKLVVGLGFVSGVHWFGEVVAALFARHQRERTAQWQRALLGPKIGTDSASFRRVALDLTLR